MTRTGTLGDVDYAYVEDDTQLILYRLGYVDGHLADGARLDSDGVWRPSYAAVMVFAGDTSTMSPIKEPRAAEVAALLGGSLDSPTVVAGGDQARIDQINEMARIDQITGELAERFRGVPVPPGMGGTPHDASRRDP